MKFDVVVAQDEMTKEQALREHDEAPMSAPTVERLAIPGPSCSGGAHRRCLLSADLCCCPCHQDAPVPYPTPARRSPVYTCAACGKPFSTSQNRRFHVFDEHPVSAAREGAVAYR